MRQRVLDAVQRTGYVPNRMAGGLASARSRLIAAVVPSTVMSVFMETIEALNSTLFDAGYQLMLGQSGYSADREELLLEAIIGRRPDGIFLTGIMGAGKGRTRLVASGIPVVETWDLTPRPSTCWWVSRTLILAVPWRSSSSPGAQAPGTGHR